MNYEEKLKEAKRLYQTANSDQKYVLESLFPEINESDDERIKKELIDFLQLHHPQFVGKRKQEKWIAWLEKQDKETSWNPSKEQFEALDYAFYSLPDTERGMHYGDILETLIEDLHKLEKQGEQKPTDKPKFHKGEWIISKYMHLIMQILNNDNGSYETVETDGTERNDSYGFIERNFKLWTIQDAKNGDVLAASDGSLFIFAKVVGNSAYHHFSLSKNGSREISDGKHAWETANACYPATKEQRDLLFSKMKEAGYEWDAEKKELKSLVTNGGDFCESENCEQKLTWSEEDEKKRNLLISILNVNHPNGYFKANPANTLNMEAIHTEELVDWLKSLRPQNTWKPSEEQMEVLLSEVTAWKKGCPKQIVLESLYNDLKKL